MLKIFTRPTRVKAVSRAPAARQRKPGDFFKDVTGRSVDEFSTIEEIDAAVAKAKKINGQLPLVHIGSDFVTRNGDVFPHRETGAADALLNRIDAALDRKF